MVNYRVDEDRIKSRKSFMRKEGFLEELVLLAVTRISCPVLYRREKVSPGQERGQPRLVEVR